MTDKTEAQPEALRLAAEFEDCIRIDAIPSINDVKKSAAELLRQHAEIQQLKAQLSARQAAPDGWRLVPVASTAAMEWAFRSAEVRYSNGAGRMLPMDPHSAFKAQYRDMLSAAPPPPEREPLTELQKQALAVYLPPFQFSHGYVFDSAGRMVADEGREHELDQLASTVGMRIRGWGHLGKLKNGAAVQDTIGELAAEALNAFWKQHGIGAANG
ncbi:hypothetical protein [Comamonas sp. 23]|uniref:hypothetical protein n=1 Tax=Comamonas sp. 23 TaxID=3415008 RepID=UPI003C6FD46F